MILSTQSQGKNLTYDASMKDYSIHCIKKSYGQGGQDVTKSLKDMKTVDLNDEDPTRKISTKKDDKIKSIEQTGYNMKYKRN